MSDGADVKQLETALSELGYFQATPNEHFDWNTIAAIKRWQKALGLTQDGTLPLGTVLFAPEDVRVGALKSRVGDTARDRALCGLVLAPGHLRQPQAL